MKTTRDLSTEHHKTKNFYYAVLFAILGCACMVMGLTNFIIANPITGCTSMSIGIMNLGLALYYHQLDHKKTK